MNLCPIKALASSDTCFYNFKKADFVTINQLLSGVEWERELSDTCVDQVVERFYTKIDSLIQKFVPIRRVRRGFPIHSFEKTIKIIEEKKEYHTEYEKYNDLNAYNRFCLLRSVSKQIIRDNYKNT